ncbi:MAG: HlyD family efflux transporter periplasmic adaptor subunit, partial [Planctomycetota bacterium]
MGVTEPQPPSAPLIRRRLAPALSAVVILAVAAGLVAAVAGGGADDPGTVVPPVGVKATAVELLDGYAVDRTFLGQVEPKRESVLGFELPGVLLSVTVEEGDAVIAGQTLATLDTAKLVAKQGELNARLAAAEALLAELKAGPRQEDVDAAAAEAARRKALAEQAALLDRRIAGMAARGAVTQREADDARLAAEAAKASLAAAVADLKELQAGTRPERLLAQKAEVKRVEAELNSVAVDIRKSELKAPFAGRIAARLADEGAVLSPGAGVVDLLETDALRVRLGVAGGTERSFRVGQPRTVTIDGADYETVVAAVRPDRSGRTRTVDVLLEFAADALPTDPAARPRRGDLARVAVSRFVPEPCVAVPIAALT